MSKGTLDTFEKIRSRQIDIVNKLLERKQISIAEGATLLCTIGPVEVSNGGQLIMGDKHEHIEKKNTL